MSHANGQVFKLTGELLGWFEYNGTEDTACSRIYATKQEMKAHWRTDNERECTCGKLPQSVILFTDYGSGFRWKAEACMACLAITSGFDPLSDHCVEV